MSIYDHLEFRHFKYIVARRRGGYSGQAILMILLFINQIHTTVTRTNLLLHYNSG